VTEKDTKRRYALKILDTAKTAKFEDRFKGVEKPSEAEIAMQLRHPHVVMTYETGISKDDEQFLLMEYVDGHCLSYLTELQNERMKKHCLRLMIQLGQAMQYLNETGWLHHDLCPRNVMVTKDNKIKLIDFGLAVPNTPEFHKPGNRTGTAQYMAPELIKRQKVDQRIDVFAYAMTCYEMLTGQLPWEAADTKESVIKYMNMAPVDIRELKPNLDMEIAQTIMKGVSQQPDQRYKNVGEMVSHFISAFRRMKAQKSAQQ